MMDRETPPPRENPQPPNYREITESPGFASADELYTFIREALMSGDARFPILGINDQGNLRIFMQTQGEKREHVALLNSLPENLRDATSIVFASGLEILRQEEAKALKPRLKLARSNSRVSYVTLTDRSDYFYKVQPTNSEHFAKLKDIFEKASGVMLEY